MEIATNVIFVEDLYRIAWEVASALEFLASKNVIHRDVAARNILLTLQKTSKLSDFGLSRSSNEALYTSHGGCLPIKWTALEAIEFGIFTEKADVWSFGVLLWEMFSFGDTPYEDLEPSRLLGELQKGFRLIPPHRTPTQISEVMTSCWKTRLTNRPTFQEKTGNYRRKPTDFLWGPKVTRHTRALLRLTTNPTNHRWIVAVRVYDHESFPRPAATQQNS
ncbi:unnamed protein product, partial [Mesorhabditis belari]|uniref:receptor protein-tyrosine kinase n=1 Tax=Mesorhabditis belari TaxID=2138241 RepID=A0AAF3J5Z0_9BILA